MTPDDWPNYAEKLQHFSEWKAAYQLAFGRAHDSPAFADLCHFCHANRTCVVPGDRDQSLVMEGRRQVYLRIMNYLERSPEELVTLFTKPLEGDKANG